jgi:hypothetical protein
MWTIHIPESTLDLKLKDSKKVMQLVMDMASDRVTKPSNLRMFCFIQHMQCFYSKVKMDRNKLLNTSSSPLSRQVEFFKDLNKEIELYK